MIIQDTILKRNQQWLEDKLAKINKRAKKLGVAEFKITFENDRLAKDIEGERFGFDPNAPVVDVTIEGDPPKIAGWELVSVFEREGEVVMTRTVPGIDNLPYYPTEIKCEHCGYSRRRKRSYLMSNPETLEFKEIGSTCIKDYFGHDPKKFVWGAQIDWSGMLDEARDINTEIRYSFADDCFDLVEFLSLTKAAINVHGWMSKGKANEINNKADYEGTENYVDSTSCHVHRQYMKMKRPKDYERVEKLFVEDDDIEFAKAAIAHFNEITEITDYIFNVKNILKLNYVPDTKMGLAASIVGSYYVKIQREKEQAARESTFKASEWQGEIKERREWNLTYTYSSTFENQFGTQFIHNFKDADGNFFKWFTGNNLYIYEESKDRETIIRNEDAAEGDVVVMVGTVKNHDEYKGKKSTVLTRCKIKDIKKPNQGISCRWDRRGF